MEIKRLFYSDAIKYLEKIEQARLVWPFDDSHQSSRKRLLKAIRERQAFLLVGQSHTLFISGVVQDRKWQIDNLLAVTSDAITWEQALILLETAARQRCMVKISLELSADKLLSEWLLANGYSLNQSTWEKALNYQTALVLGGGGAHGAYQIGAWQALMEKQLKVDLICGTSVGALNGALIAQNDFAVAFELWQKIETNQVLNFTYQQLDEADFTAQLETLRQFVKEAVLQKGVSTQPLRELLQAQIDFEVLNQSVPLHIVTTKVPSFTEVVVWLNQMEPPQMIEWLLASSSFFPMMSMTEISGEYYVDGGYRNNLPRSVAIDQGATELITVDIHGPGIDREFSMPDTIAENRWKSPWSLGDLLLFQSSRSQGNLALGYLETKRQLEDLPGTWYTFTSYQELQNLTIRFASCLKKAMTIDLVAHLATLKENTYPPELASLYFLEQWGRFLQVSPLNNYSVAEFRTVMLAQLETTDPLAFSLTVQEQWQTYWQSRNFFSDYQQILRIKSAWQKQPNRCSRFLKYSLRQTLLAVFLIFIQEEF